MTNQEEIKTRIGWDATAVEKGTRDMLRQQQAAATEYVGFWSKALKTREAETAATEARINDASLVRLRANMTARETMEKAWLAKKSVESEIAGGSGAFGSIANATGGLGGVGREAKELEKGLHGSSTAIREVQVLIHEGLRGNFKRMIGSASILASALGLLLPVGLVAAGLAIVAGPAAWRTYKARQDAEQSGKDLDTRTGDASETARQKIQDLYRVKLIDEKQKSEYERRLKNGGYENVIGVLGDVNKLTPGIAAAEEKSELKKRQEEDQRQMEGLQERGHTLAEYAADEKERNKENLVLKQRMDKLDQDSVEYARLKTIYADNELQSQKDKTEEKRLQAEADEKQKTANQEATNLSRRITQNQREMGQVGAEFPTIEEIAGRRWSKRFAAQYGAGGRFDLGRGRGVGTADAREYERAKYQQQYDRENAQDIDYYDFQFGRQVHISRGDQIKADQDRMNAARGRLERSGLASPQMTLEKMQENTAAMQAHLDALINKGAKINVVPKDDDNET